VRFDMETRSLPRRANRKAIAEFGIGDKRAFRVVQSPDVPVKIGKNFEIGGRKSEYKRVL